MNNIYIHILKTNTAFNFGHSAMVPTGLACLIALQLLLLAVHASQYQVAIREKVTLTF